MLYKPKRRINPTEKEGARTYRWVTRNPEVPSPRTAPTIRRPLPFFAFLLRSNRIKLDQIARGSSLFNNRTREQRVGEVGDGNGGGGELKARAGGGE
jgi:hypothetical protein